MIATVAEILVQHQDGRLTTAAARSLLDEMQTTLERRRLELAQEQATIAHAQQALEARAAKPLTREVR